MLTTTKSNRSSDHYDLGNFELTCDIFNDLIFEDNDSTKYKTKLPSNVDATLHSMQDTIPKIKYVPPIVFEEVLQRSKIQKTISYQQLSIKELISIDIDQVPDYLRQTNHSFDKCIYSMRPNLPKTCLEPFKQVAILMHKTLLIDKLKRLWTLYRKSGMGQLKIPEQLQQCHLRLWSKHIRARVKHIHDESSIEINNDDDYNTQCQLFADECLKKLSDKFYECHHYLRLDTVHLFDYTFNMEQTIQKFIQRNFLSQSLQYDCQIETVEYHYIDTLIKRQYANEHPTDKQMDLFKSLSKAKYDEVIWIYNLKYLQETQSNGSTLNHIGNLLQKCWPMFDGVNEITEPDHLLISVSKAEEQIHQCRQRLNLELDQMWQNEKNLPVEQRLTSRMLYLLQQNFANIDANLACINKYRIQLFKRTSLWF